MVAAWVLFGLSSVARAGDWPTYRHDLARSGVTSEALRFPLYEQWSHAGAPAPKPAWPEPGREHNRLPFDYAYDVAVAGGVVYFGSSADHKVYAVDLSTGRARWSFLTGGPVRFSPTIADGRVFVGSDDGWLYCLSASDGKLLWRFRGGRGDDRILGNGQLISRWPLRCGVGVRDGVVTVPVGMWPSEGVYVYALRASDGKVLWLNDTSGSSYLRQPHPGAHSITGVAPQGYVLARGEQVFVPTGRNVPAAYDRKTGKLLYYRSAPTAWINRWGGTWNFLAGGLLFGWHFHHGPDIDIMLGEYKGDPRDGIIAYDAASGAEKREFPGKRRAVVGGGVLYAVGSGEVCAYDLAGWVDGAKADACLKWKAPHERAYSMVLAGGALVVGGRDTVMAFNVADGATLWSEKVSGSVRSLAIADGRLLVSTPDGRVRCFASAPAKDPARISRGDDDSPFRKDAAGAPPVARARALIAAAGSAEGYCVVLGSGDGRLLYHLARQSRWRIFCLDRDAARVSAARRALDAARLYGERVTVHHAEGKGVGYPDYLADVVLPGDGVAVDLSAFSAADVYRMLRPGGGVALLRVRGADAAAVGAAEKLFAPAGAARGEVARSGEVLRVTRGKLPGAGDWTHQYASAARTGSSTDRRVRVPMKLLWFGEPGPARLITRHWGGPSPLCVDGRLFVIGQRSVEAVDAYNGRPLWRRDFKTAGWWPVRTRGSSVAADADGLYLVQGKTCLRLDARTGKTLATYTMPPLPAGLPARKPPDAWSYLAVSGGRILGSIGGRSDARCVFVLGKDGTVRWSRPAAGSVSHNALAMDAGRVYLIDRTCDWDLARAGRRGRQIPVAWDLLALDADTGKELWRNSEDLRGRTALWLSDGVLLATSSTGMTGYSAGDGKRLYTVKAKIRRFPVLTGGTIYAEPYAYDLRTGKPARRVNPFTGAKSAWAFRRSYGCGSISGGPNVLMFRSGTLGIYDLAGDGGVYNFGGVRAGCYVNAIAAAGLVLAPPADAACTCSYSFRTTVALAPDDSQRDWSIFYDQLPKAPVRQCLLNLGAVGDWRESDKRVWLAVPRPVTRTRRADFAMPFRATLPEGFGPYRRDRRLVRVAGTERPGIYASGLAGPLRLELDLEILEPGYTAWPTAASVAIDGKTTDACWDGYKPIGIEREKATVFLRHDDKRLYLSCVRPRPVDKLDKPRPWKAKVRGDDSAIWKDDSFEVYLGTVPGDPRKAGTRCVHLGVSASGARYDALWTRATPRLGAIDIPRVDVAADGNAADWGDGGLVVTSLTAPGGKMRSAKDFDPSFRVGYSNEGLCVLATIRDNVVHEWENDAQLSKGDGIDLYLATKPGERGGYRCAIAPGTAPAWRPTVKLYDRRTAAGRDKLTARVAGRRTRNGYVVEAILPWKNLRIAPRPGATVAVQVIATDDDMRGDHYRFRAMWHKAGEPTADPLAYQVFRLAEKPAGPIAFKRGRSRDRAGLYTATKPHALPVAVPALGARPEDAARDLDWSSAVTLAPESCTFEMAIPWKTLAAAGLDRARLMADLTRRGRLTRPPLLGDGYQRLIAVPESLTRPRTLSVRLHFAELADVGPGRRVFDVKLQGRCVLKDFDVAAAAGGGNRAVVREFQGIRAARALVVELVPKAGSGAPPILSAIELSAQP